MHNILLVDDELHVVRALERTFRREYNVFSATNGEDALAIMEQNDIALIITDQRMPEMTGVELLAWVSRNYPFTTRIILTAYGDSDAKLLMDAINVAHAYSYVSKPWETEEMRAIVRQGIVAYEAWWRIKTEKRRIGEILVDNGVISVNQLEAALEQQKPGGRLLGEILVDLGYTDEASIYSCYALQLGMPYVSLSQLPVGPKFAELLPLELAYKHNIVPVDAVGGVLTVATSEPLSDEARSEIEEGTGYKVTVVCSLLRDVEAALKQCYPDQ
jgi:CheY-like chemotaxis protein